MARNLPTEIGLLVYIVQEQPLGSLPFYISDIKPENLLIGKDDTLKLCDFGRYSLYIITPLFITGAGCLAF